ncbi:MAG: hypothetical protein WC346_04775 [Methanogenium sp.]|jgi:hypothetical protein
MVQKERGINMYICVECRKEMLCDKNGVGANFGGVMSMREIDLNVQIVEK